jgi:cell division septation protein DedD
MTRGMARGIAKEKTETKKGIEKSATKNVLNTKVVQQKAVPAGKYSVNVVSYQQEWFAQSKAAEFKQKGIPVEVVPVEANKIGTRYRLKVAGFKNKAEANAYADKIKKSHNLGESWVGEN